jgi:hypothetical protein
MVDGRAPRCPQCEFNSGHGSQHYTAHCAIGHDRGRRNKLLAVDICGLCFSVPYRTLNDGSSDLMIGYLSVITGFRLCIENWGIPQDWAAIQIAIAHDLV